LATQLLAEMTQGKASQNLVNVVSDIQQKNEDIKKLEKVLLFYLRASGKFISCFWMFHYWFISRVIDLIQLS
jgi:hypothetical protein